MLSFKISIKQQCEPIIDDNNVFEDFEYAFFRPEPYFLHDSIDADLGVSMDREEITIKGKRKKSGVYFRNIEFVIVLVTKKQKELLEFFEEDGVLSDGDWDLEAFVRHFLGDLDVVFIGDEEINVDTVTVTGDVLIS